MRITRGASLLPEDSLRQICVRKLCCDHVLLMDTSGRCGPLLAALYTLAEALAELGQFYMTSGQRSKLTDPVRQSVLRHMNAARAALPLEEEKSGGAGLAGLFK